MKEKERKKKKYRPLLRVNENERKKERKTKIQKIHTRSNAFLINGKFPDNHKKKNPKTKKKQKII